MALYPASGTLLGKTTLGAAVTATANTVNLASVAVTVGSDTGPVYTPKQWGLFIDAEILWVEGAPVGNNVPVSRGRSGTSAGAHGNGQNVWLAPLSSIPDVGPAYTPSFPTRYRFETVPIGSVAYASFGNNTTAVSGTIYYSDLVVTQGMVATGLGLLIGTTGGTNLGLTALYDSVGNLVASSAIAGATVGTASTIQQRAFSPGPIWVPSGQYFLVFQQNGATATIATIAASTFTNVLTASATGTFGMLPASITVPTTFTANVGPIGYIY